MANSVDRRQQFDDIVERFEQAWNDGQRPNISYHLPADATQRYDVLWELVQIDLELDLKSGGDNRVEDYLDRYPELRDDPARLEAFVFSELEIRSRQSPVPDLAEYQCRFPQLADQVSRWSAHHRPGPLWDASPNNESQRYHRLRILGEGGLGRVWIAWDRKLEREVAIKEIHPRCSANATSRKRFHAEAGITSRLQHPGIVSIYDQGQDAEGRPFYVMRRVEGQSLREEIRKFHDTHRSSAERHFELRRLLRTFIDVCETVQFAHEQSVLHRDLKPHNVIVGAFGEAVVVDWGLAKVIQTPSATSDADVDSMDLQHQSPIGNPTDSMTSTGQTIGSPGYMSPEQSRLDANALSPLSDVYSLGAILYSILTNRRPKTFRRRSEAGELERLTFAKPSSVCPLVSKPLDFICEKALSFHAAERHVSAAALAHDVEAYLANEKILGHTESVFERCDRWLRRHRGAALLGMIALACVAILSAAAAVVIRQQHNETRELNRHNVAAKRFFLDLFQSADPYEQATTERTVDLLKLAGNKIPSDWPLSDQAMLLDIIASSLQGRSDYDEALRTAEDLMRVAEQSGETKDLVRAMVRKGSILDFRGDKQEAKRWIDRATDLAIANLGDQDRATVTCRAHAACLDAQLGNLSDGIAALEQCLLHYDAKDDDKYCDFVSSLGAMYAARGDLTKAEQRLSEAVELGRQHNRVVEKKAKANLVQVYSRLGELSKSVSLAREIVDYSIQRFGRRSGQSVSSVLTLATALQQAGDWKQARELYEENLTMAESVLAAGSPEIIIHCVNLTELCMNLDAAGSALHYGMKAQQLCEDNLPPNHPIAQQAFSNLFDAIQRVCPGGRLYSPFCATL